MWMSVSSLFVATEKYTIRLVSQLTALLAKGEFRLTKWLNNCTNALDKAPPADRAKTFLSLSLGSEPVDRVLGVKWKFNKDEFEFCVCLKKPFTRSFINRQFVV